MAKKITAIDVANWFISNTDRDAGSAITHLKVQKLVYYAQSWYLALNNKKLFDGEFQAWTHGPVEIGVWHHFKEHSYSDITEPKGCLPEFDKETDDYLESVHQKYSIYDAKELERFTHEEDPWKITRGGLPLEAKCIKNIDEIIMRDFYTKQLGEEAWQEEIAN